jgi:hypothetical protein
MNESTPSTLACAYHRGAYARLSAAGQAHGHSNVKVRLISRMLSRGDCSRACALGNLLTAPSGRSLGFFRYRNKRSAVPHRRHTAQRSSSHYNSRGRCAPERTILPALLYRPLWPLQDQEGRADRADRLRLWRLEGPAVPGRLSDQVELRRKPPVQMPK